MTVRWSLKKIHSLRQRKKAESSEEVEMPRGYTVPVRYQIVATGGAVKHRGGRHGS